MKMPLALSSTLVSPRRWRAAGIHFAASCGVAALAAAVIFLLWFPSPLGTIAGGTDLFVLLISVDVIAGPALTFVAASPGKLRAELQRDLAVIALFQLCAFGYGVYSISEARPVLVSFEVDRFRVVTAAEIDAASLPAAPVALRTLPWAGPRLIAAAKPVDPDQVLRSIQLGLSGIDLSMDPRQWRPYEAYADEAWKAAKPLDRVLEKYPGTRPEVAKISAAFGAPASDLRYLPLQSRRASWVAVLAAPGARLVGYLPVDGFF